ncbi:hypothetical protein C7H09_04870 [Marinobacter fuscus]|uniref:Uncharacterized protein n=1 Tax=Marinobacter fuscus TaxID=2109942 RepID=A0A2T1KC43_9GAMM|nr:hypothetical protein [Marinobacter fuscus]PSF06224.1 hypothetical protein C7H09_10845 [Marinobacter fuscus]PSF07577.1 hypothetical protein C7H09_09490 [Marinobacter fuscus]PSF07584.1 hypothetical protein C7H09_09470 [Marinobacter fuscus]PSF07686.1 hypothetical protein C7H09_09455 [Marinobacter fuscus]PSF09938.1 hypothetical protein C7H09_07485 [Marinobacter fuscus]
MNSIIEFMLESAVVNSIPIFFAAGIIALIGGPLLKKAGIGTYFRGLIYSVIGVSAGVWSYTVFDIPGRGIELLEFATLTVGMLLYSLVIIMPIVAIKNRAKT